MKELDYICGYLITNCIEFYSFIYYYNYIKLEKQ